MSDRLYSDCNAAYGRRPNKPPEARWTLAHLLEDLDLAGIAGALVYHRQAVHYEPMLGNRGLVAEIAGHRDRLSPCWVVGPELGDGFPTPSLFLREMRDAGVRAVRLEHEALGVPPSEQAWAPLRDALRGEGTLCVVPINSYQRDFDATERMLAIFRDCPTLIVNHGWPQWRHVVALMDAFPNLHLEFSQFQANRAIEFFAQRYGAERCLFGTGLPEKAPGAARGFLDFTLLTPDAAAKIAGGNLRRLLRGEGPGRPPAPTRWNDAITAAVRRGDPLPCLALDAHCHIGHDGCSALGERTVAHRGDAEGMLELTRRAGIDRTAIMSWAGPLSMDTDLGNRIVEDAVRRYPDEFIGLATVNPDYDDQAAIARIIQRYHVELKFPGLKTFTPAQTIDYDDPKLDRWLRFGNDHRLYMVFDPKGGVAATPVARNLATRYPDLSIHLDHCGQSWEYAKWAAELLREHRNLVAQLNYTTVTNGVIEWLVGQVGADRVLFGTDSPMRDPRPQVGWLAYTRLAEADKRKVFGENFAAILARVRL